MNDALDQMFGDVKLLGVNMLFGSRSMASRPATENFVPSKMIGSRIDDSTDWDFSAPHNEKNHQVLISKGFSYWPKSDLSYRDDLTMGVYIKGYPHKFDMKNPQIYSGHPVANVVLRNDYHIFRQVWESIDPEFYYQHLWKRGPRYEFSEMAQTKTEIRNIMNQLFKTAGYMI